MMPPEIACMWAPATDPDGPSEPTKDARTQGALASIMARQQPDSPFVESERRLLICATVVESSERPTEHVGRVLSGRFRLNRPTAVVGGRLSGKCRSGLRGTKTGEYERNVTVHEIDLTDRVAKYPIFATGRQWPDGDMLVGKTGKKHMIVTQYPQLAEHPDYRPLFEDALDLEPPKPGERGGGFVPVLRCLRDHHSGHWTERLACVFWVGAPHIGPGSDTVISFSDDRGKTWSEPIMAVRHDPELRFDYRHGAFGQTPNGDLLIMYWLTDVWSPDYTRRKEGDESFSEVRLVRSTDMGSTWSEPVRLNFLDKTNGVAVGPHGPILQVSENTLVVNLRGGDPRPNRHSFLAWSYDDGRTWDEVTLIRAPGWTETNVLPLEDKEWLAYSRTNVPRNNTPWMGRSHDGGKTWPDWEQLVPSRYMVPGHILKLPRNRVAIIHTYREYPFGVRAFLSRDGGVTFDTRTSYVICDSFFMWDGGYPRPVLFEDGQIVVSAWATLDREHRTWGTCAVAMAFHESDLD